MVIFIEHLLLSLVLLTVTFSVVRSKNHNVGNVYVKRFFDLRLPMLKNESNPTFRFRLDSTTSYTVLLESQPTPFAQRSQVVIFQNGKIKNSEFISDYHRRIYVGELLEDSKATVVGALSVKGIFEGLLSLSNGSRLHIDATKDDVSYNAVAYWANDLITCDTSKTTLSECGLDPKKAFKRDVTRPDWQPLPSTYEERTKREVTTTFKDDYVHICNLSIVVDHLYFSRVAGEDKSRALREVEIIIFYADAYFRKADLNQDGKSDSYGFRITNVVILTNPSTVEDYKHEKANVTEEWVPYAFFGEYLANRIHFENHCAGLFFTYRLMDQRGNGFTQLKVNFEHEIYKRGFCSKSFEHWPTKKPIDDYTKSFSNALPVNFYDQGRPASTALAIASTVHQLGHLFHAQDDPDTRKEECSSNDDKRNFFMNVPIPKTLDGIRFSPCSLRDMKYLIETKKTTNIYCIFDCQRTTEGGCNSTTSEGSTVEPLTTINPQDRLKKTGECFGGSTSVSIMAMMIWSSLFLQLFVLVLML